MSTNGINNAEDADMADCDQEKVVTMMDVLKEQEEFEENANAVLGASDEKECTYSKGYIKRQALYACLTCCSDAKSDPDKCAGICLACSLNCHENHELVELYTKRNFRCDCGNPKFNSHPCTYTPEKTTLNEDNTYNQNFCGLYCTCHRPYPDPDSKVEEEMIQCVICEDWLHASHLEAALPPNEQYAEMICKGCMDKNEFLHDYSKYAVNYNENSIVDVVNDSAADISISNGDESHITNDQNNSIRMNAEVESANAENKMEVNGDKETLMEVETKQDETEHSIPSSADVNNVTTSTDEQLSTEVAITETSISKTDLQEADEATAKNNETITENSAEGSKDTIETDKENPTVEDASETKLEKSTEEGELKQTENTEGKSNVDESSSNPHDETEEPATDQPEPIKDETISQIDELLGENDTKEKTVNESQLTDTENIKEQINEVNGDTSTKETCEAEAKLAEEQSVSVEAKESLETNGDSSNPEENSDDSKSAVPNDSIEPNKRKLSTDRTDDDDEISTKKAKVDSGACTRPKDARKVFKGATFWPSNFRQKLCTCNECTTMYKDLSVLFLTDLEDTVTYYEDLGKEKGSQPTQYEKGLQALSSLDRVQQINALTEYNIMKNRLVDFLKGYQDRQEIVKEEDIKAFFAGMKPKRESDGVYFCR